MRIEIVGDDSINPQARTYAEYRLDVARLTVSGAHPYAAINRAVERLGLNAWPDDFSVRAPFQIEIPHNPRRPPFEKEEPP